MSQPPPLETTQPIGYQPPQPPKKRRNRVLIGVGATLALCVVCGIIGLVGVARGGSSVTPTVAAQAPTSAPIGTTIAAVGGQTATATAPAGAVAKATEVTKPTATTKPEPTAKPTNTPIPPKPTNTPIPPPKMYGLNELASVKNWNLAVAGVDRPGKEFVWSEFNNKSLAAGTWFIVALDMKNTGNSNFGVNTTDFELLANGGITYKISTEGGVYAYPAYKKAQNIGGQVPPGVTVRYYLIFDVAPDASDLQLVFKQDTKPTFAVGNAAP
jgi:hypothetical protein